MPKRKEVDQNCPAPGPKKKQKIVSEAKRHRVARFLKLPPTKYYPSYAYVVKAALNTLSPATAAAMMQQILIPDSPAWLAFNKATSLTQQLGRYLLEPDVQALQVRELLQPARLPAHIWEKLFRDIGPNLISWCFSSVPLLQLVNFFGREHLAAVRQTQAQSVNKFCKFVTADLNRFVRNIQGSLKFVQWKERKDIETKKVTLDAVILGLTKNRRRVRVRAGDNEFEFKPERGVCDECDDCQFLRMEHLHVTWESVELKDPTESDDDELEVRSCSDLSDSSEHDDDDTDDFGVVHCRQLELASFRELCDAQEDAITRLHGHLSDVLVKLCMDYFIPDLNECPTNAILN